MKMKVMQFVGPGVLDDAAAWPAMIQIAIDRDPTLQGKRVTVLHITGDTVHSWLDETERRDRLIAEVEVD